MKNRIGIIGGGQLGRMLTYEAKKMGFHVTVIDPTPQSPAGQVADHQIVAGYNDEKAIRELATLSDFLTFEIELANAAVLDELASKGLQIHPSAKTLTIIKDKYSQKVFLRKAKIPVADFVSVETVEDIEKAAKKFGYPILLKARFDAYDGRGNALVKSKNDIPLALEKLSPLSSSSRIGVRDKLQRGSLEQEIPDQARLAEAPAKRVGNDTGKFYVEKFVPFVKELAVVVARSIKGEIKTYPVVETIHQDNICHIVMSPAPVDAKILKKAEKLATQVMKLFKGAGVFGIEMFLTKDGKVIINEIAPRVHNSGHHTIESTVTSQFEQHIRAVTGLPLGETAMIAPAAVMINILGDRQGAVEVTGLEKVLAMPHTAVHIYGKAETKNQRKMGHITVIGTNLKQVLKKAKRARELISI